jgi:hypothetical protein
MAFLPLTYPTEHEFEIKTLEIGPISRSQVSTYLSGLCIAEDELATL